MRNLIAALYFKSPWDENNKEENVFMKKRSSIKPPNLDFGFNFRPKVVALVIGVIVLLWLLSGIYQVQEGEEAIIMRFGRVTRKATAGLNYHLPSPIEKKHVEKVNQSRGIEIGYRGSYYQKDTKNMLSESIMITGDENIVDLNTYIIWSIKDLEAFILNVQDPEKTIKDVSESSIREIVGRRPISSVLSSQKQEIAKEIEDLIQSTLDIYKIGVQIEQVQLLKAEPPEEVIASYRDVQAARADKERKINQAYSYRNDIIPKARGKAEEMVLQAQGYKQSVIARAQGDVERFNSIYAEYINGKNITKDRMMMDTAVDILKNANKIVTNSGLIPHMPLEAK